jgi:DNA-binding CsgD family transcriptional regulator
MRVTESSPTPRAGPVSSKSIDHVPATPLDQLSERQRAYLRLVFEHRTSQEIGFQVGASGRAVDKQLQKAKDLLGVTSRFEAARLLAEHEAGVERLYPANDLPSPPPTFPLPSPLPTSETAANMLNWKQVVSWSAIIAIVTPIGLTVAAMVIVALMLLIGLKAT